MGRLVEQGEWSLGALLVFEAPRVSGRYHRRELDDVVQRIVRRVYDCKDYRGVSPESLLFGDRVMEDEHGEQVWHWDQKRCTKGDHRVLQITNHAEYLEECARHVTDGTDKRHQRRPEADPIQQFGLVCSHVSFTISYRGRCASLML